MSTWLLKVITLQCPLLKAVTGQCRRMKDTMTLELIKIFMNDLGKTGSREVTEFSLTQTYLDLTILKLMV